jgi:hypothetical protein
LEKRVEVTFDVDVSRDVGASESELTGVLKKSDQCVASKDVKCQVIR